MEKNGLKVSGNGRTVALFQGGRGETQVDADFKG